MVAALKIEVKVDDEVKRIRSRSWSRLNLEPCTLKLELPRWVR